MSTIKDEYKKFVEKCGDAGDKIIGYAIIGSNLNMLAEDADELDDADIINAFDALIELINSKCDILIETDVE